MEQLILSIRVTCEEPLSVKGHTRDIVMIPFTGEASGPWFTGRIVGPGVDTQKIGKGEKPALSARYMLEGEDRDGKSCKIFIENQGIWGGAFTPMVVTDSEALKDWETARLRASVDGIPGGVMVSIYRVEGEG